MKREVSWSAVIVVAAAVAVIAFSGYLLASWPPDPPASTLPAGSTSAPSTATEGESAPAEDTTLVVLGDSFSAESPASTGPEWPQIVADDLGWTLVNESVNNSGYLEPGAGEPFGKRVQQVLDDSPDVIIVAGGERDLARPVADVAVAAADVITRLADGAPEAQIVVLSPFSNGAPGPLTSQFSSDLKDISKENQVTYVDATRWLTGQTNFFAPDGVHPTDAGQKRIAKRMEQALVRRGIAEQPTSSPGQTTSPSPSESPAG